MFFLAVFTFIAVVGSFGFLVYVLVFMDKPSESPVRLVRTIHFVNPDADKKWLMYMFKHQIPDSQLQLYWACLNGDIQKIEQELKLGAELDVYCVALACYPDDTNCLGWILLNGCIFDDRIVKFLADDYEHPTRRTAARNAMVRCAKTFDALRQQNALRKYDDKNHIENFITLLRGTLASMDQYLTKPIHSLDPFLER